MAKQLRYKDDLNFEYIRTEGQVNCLEMIAQQNISAKGAVKGDVISAEKWVTCPDLIVQQNIMVSGAIKGKAICGGKVAITPIANTPTKVTVHFPQEMSNIPEVIVSPITTVPGVGITGVGSVNTTLEQTEIYITRTNTTQTIISWIAFVA